MSEYGYTCFPMRKGMWWKFHTC